MAPTGIFFSSNNYFYSGDVSASRGFALVGGYRRRGLRRCVPLRHTLLWVRDAEVLGARPGLGLAILILDHDLDAGPVLGLGEMPVAGSRTTNSKAAIGDPLIVSLLGWNNERWHTTLNGLVNLPMGSCDQNRLVNASFNRWAMDLTVGATYLDTDKGG